MIEPTETEPPEAIEAFAEAMIAIAEEAERDPNVLMALPGAPPSDASTRRLPHAVRPFLRWQEAASEGS